MGGNNVRNHGSSTVTVVGQKNPASQNRLTTADLLAQPQPVAVDHTRNYISPEDSHSVGTSNSGENGGKTDKTGSRNGPKKRNINSNSPKHLHSSPKHMSSPKHTKPPVGSVSSPESASQSAPSGAKSIPSNYSNPSSGMKKVNNYNHRTYHLDRNDSDNPEMNSVDTDRSS